MQKAPRFRAGLFVFGYRNFRKAQSRDTMHTPIWEADMAHKEQRNNREKKKPKQDKNKKDAAQRPGSLFTTPPATPKGPNPPPPQNKSGS
jgi:hypothetical protein